MKRKFMSLLVVAMLAASLAGCSFTEPKESRSPLPAPSTQEPDKYDEVPSIEEFEAPEEETALSVHFLNLGQEDCTVLQTAGLTMLIDSGSKASSAEVVEYLTSLGVKRIDYLIASHAHESHMGGMNELLGEFEVGTVIAPQTAAEDKFYPDFQATLEQLDKDITTMHAGDSFNFGTCLVSVLGPVSESGMEIHNTSLVLKIDCGETSFLFAGDAEKAEEQSILATTTDLSSTVLKVGNHGKDTSTSYPFLKAIKPYYAVISTEGMPGEQTLAVLNEMGVQIYSTDTAGTVIFESDGKDVSVSTTSNQSGS